MMSFIPLSITCQDITSIGSILLTMPSFCDKPWYIGDSLRGDSIQSMRGQIYAARDTIWTGLVPKLSMGPTDKLNA